MWTKGLNPEQAEAVMHNQGPMLILAGAGSGKTTVVVARAGRLIAEKVARPTQICVLTFTNKAAKELKHRVSEKVGKSAKGIWAGTFHSFGLEVLRKYHKEAELPKGFGIIDGTDARGIVKEILTNIRAPKENFDTEKIIAKIDDWRARKQKKSRPDTADEYDEITEVVLPKYLSRLRALGVTDFQGLLLKPLEVFKKHPEALEHYQSRFQQLMVDEFQDTNDIQMKLVRLLVEKHNNITVVGDDDQSIYGWRGAEIKNILNFPKRFTGCNVVRLERNYRSSSKILDVANAVIAKNSQRHDKVLKAQTSDIDEQLPEVFVFENDEVEVEETVTQVSYFKDKGYNHGDIAILFRSNSQGGLLEAQLRYQQIPYAMTGGTAFFDRKEIRDALAYLRCAFRPNELAFRRILNTPSRGIGETTVKHLEKLSQEKKRSLFATSKLWEEAGILPRVGKAIEDVHNKLDYLAAQLLSSSGSKGAGDQLLQFLVDVGYKRLILKNSKDAAAAQKRWQFMEIFARVLDGFIVKGGRNQKSYNDFIDSMELRDVADSEKGDEGSKVQLLTLHASKGLEFPVVIINGLEEDILPHKMLGSDIDEERRLFYVGLTRAKERLILTRSQVRKKYGRWQPSSPSRFLLEIPENSFTEFPNGARPLQEGQRERMLSDLFSKLDSKIKQNESEQDKV